MSNNLKNKKTEKARIIELEMLWNQWLCCSLYPNQRANRSCKLVDSERWKFCSKYTRQSWILHFIICCCTSQELRSAYGCLFSITIASGNWMETGSESNPSSCLVSVSISSSFHKDATFTIFNEEPNESCLTSYDSLYDQTSEIRGGIRVWRYWVVQRMGLALVKVQRSCIE